MSVRGNAAGGGSGAEGAKAVVREYFRRVFDEGDPTACEELLAPDYVDHDAPPNTPPGPDATKQFLSGFLHTYPDMRFRVEDLIAEGDKVVVRATWRGTSADSGEGFRQMGIVILRLDEDGRLAERWSAYGPLE